MTPPRPAMTENRMDKLKTLDGKIVLSRNGLEAVWLDDENPDTIHVVLPEGATLTVLSADSGLALRTRATSSSALLDVVTERVSDRPELRAPVQGDRERPPGTIAWEEHERAWRGYSFRYGKYRSAKRIAERGGFGHAELKKFLGHEPTTWEPR